MKLSEISPDEVEVVSTRAPLRLSDISPEDIEDSGTSVGEDIVTGARNFAQGGTFGFSDEIAGGVEAAGRALGLKGLGVGNITDLSLAEGGPTWSPSELSKVYSEARDRERGDLKADMEKSPILSGTTQLAGAIASPLSRLGKTATLGKAMATGIGEGALAGLGYTDADDAAGIARDIGAGGVIGGAGGALGKAAEKGADIVTPYIKNLISKSGEGFKKQAARAAAKDLGLERATAKSMGIDKVEDVGRYALDKGITKEGLGSGANPLNWIRGSSATDDMIAANSAVTNAAGDAIGSVYSKIDDAGASTFSPREAAEAVDEKIGSFWRSPLNRAESNQYDNTIESILMREGDGIGNNIPLTEAQALKKELSKKANFKKSKHLPVTDAEQMARDAYWTVSGKMDEAADFGSEALQSPGLKETLQKGRGEYSLGEKADTLLQNRLAREQGNSLFGLTDTITGAAGLGYGATTGDWGTAGGIFAAKKGLQKYGAKVAALGMDKIGDMIAASPQSFGKYAKVLQDAAKRGPQGIASTNFLLQQTDPEYRILLNQVAGNDQNQGDENASYP